MANLQTVLSTYQFKRAGDLILVFNENSYLMAEYSERAGTVKWQRVLIASQRELIEKWLHERFPSTGAAAAKPRVAGDAPLSGTASGVDRHRHAPSSARRRTSSSSAR
jgi:hypothetical protein